MKFDKYWENDPDIRCPFCSKKGLMADHHDELEATHYCKKCGESMLIVGAVQTRGVKE